jgi:plastocyanin
MRIRLAKSVSASNFDFQALRPPSYGKALGVLGFWLLVALVVGAIGADVQVLVKDQAGRPVEGAVVWAEGPQKRTLPAIQTEILQKNRQFIPPVTIVPVGSVVRFPNWDNVQHHVYSFSATKTFDIPLYIGQSPKAIEFERPGIVTLGCNIHDWMAAYVIVLDSGFFARTDEKGVGLLRDLPAGSFSIVGWCPRLRGAPVQTTLEGSQSSAELTMRLRPAFQRTPPDERGGGYR